MTKRKHLSATRLEEIEEICTDPTAFSLQGKDPEELRRLHQELDCAIDDQLLAPSLEPGAKKLRCHLMQHLQTMA